MCVCGKRSVLNHKNHINTCEITNNFPIQLLEYSFEKLLIYWRKLIFISFISCVDSQIVTVMVFLLSHIVLSSLALQLYTFLKPFPPLHALKSHFMRLSTSFHSSNSPKKTNQHHHSFILSTNKLRKVRYCLFETCPFQEMYYEIESISRLTLRHLFPDSTYIHFLLAVYYV